MRSLIEKIRVVVLVEDRASMWIRFLEELRNGRPLSREILYFGFARSCYLRARWSVENRMERRLQKKQADRKPVWQRN